jgi:hypothetical protein
MKRREIEIGLIMREKKRGIASLDLTRIVKDYEREREREREKKKRGRERENFMKLLL